MGVKTVEWSPSGQLLGVGGFDQKVLFFWRIKINKSLKFKLSNLDSFIELHNLQNDNGV